MKKLYLLSFIIAIAGVLTLAGQDILTLEDARFAAQKARDVLLLEKMLDEELLFIHSNAFEEDKKTFLENVKSGDVRYSRMEAEPGRVLIYHKKWTIVRGILQVAGKYKGTGFDIRVRYTAIYIKKNKHWLLQNWQSTKIPMEK